MKARGPTINCSFRRPTGRQLDPERILKGLRLDLKVLRKPDDGGEQRARFAPNVLMHHFGHVEVKGVGPLQIGGAVLNLGPEYLPPL